MQKFLVLFLAPPAVLDEWMKTPQEERDAEEKKMREDWDVWMEAHRSAIKETNAGGKTKKVTKQGVEDTRNDIMLYSVVEAESHEIASKIFESHPHLSIPQSSIEVMAIRGM